MRIAFFGQRNFFDYFHIGGFQSFVRRLAIGLINSGNKVDYILYDAPSADCIEVLPNLTLRYFQDFEEASRRLLTGAYDHVIQVWLSRRDRLKYLFLQRAVVNNTKWHRLYLVWPDSAWKRGLAVFEGWCGSCHGLLVSVSPRQYKALSRVSKRACHILPPVPEEYFLSPDDKKLDGKIRVTFLGNLTKDKFIEEIITLFNNLQKYPQFHCSIYGTYDHLNSHSVEVHNRLKSQQEIKYINVDMRSYSSATDTLVKEVLADTDVFVQPYRTIDNTLDLPLLLLEAMASLCAVITTPVGSVADIYGESKFIIPRQNFPRQAEALLQSLTPDDLMRERKRISERNKILNFTMSSVIDNLVSLLKR